MLHNRTQKYLLEGHHINVHFKCYYRTIPQAWVNCSCSLIFFTIIYVCIQWMFYYINMSLASFINPKERDYNDWYISVFDSHIYNNNAMWVINGLSYLTHASNILFIACHTSIGGHAILILQGKTEPSTEEILIACIVIMIIVIMLMATIYKKRHATVI